MNNKIWVPMAVGAGIGYLRGKTTAATVVGGLSGIGVGIIMNLLNIDPGLSAPAGGGTGVSRREEHAREQYIPNMSLDDIPPYTGRVKYN